VTGPAKAKGDRAEREAAQLVADLTGRHVRRLLGAGRRDDRGDLDLPGWAIQVADWQDLASALRVKPLDADEQADRHAGGHSYGAAFLRLRGGAYRVALTPQTWAAVYHDLGPAGCSCPKCRLVRDLEVERHTLHRRDT
jgi:hypothetical protein